MVPELTIQVVEVSMLAERAISCAINANSCCVEYKVLEKFWFFPGV